MYIAKTPYKIDNILHKAMIPNMDRVWRKHPLYFDLNRLSCKDKEDLFEENQKLFFEMGFHVSDLSNAYVVRKVQARTTNSKVIAVAKRVINKEQSCNLAMWFPGYFINHGFDFNRLNKKHPIDKLRKFVLASKKHSKNTKLLDSIESLYSALNATEYRLYVLSELLSTPDYELDVDMFCSKGSPTTLMLEFGNESKLREHQWHKIVKPEWFEKIVEIYFQRLIAGKCKKSKTITNAISRFREAQAEPDMFLSITNENKKVESNPYPINNKKEEQLWKQFINSW
jgi:hypothetical protein